MEGLGEGSTKKPNFDQGKSIFVGIDKSFLRIELWGVVVLIFKWLNKYIMCYNTTNYITQSIDYLLCIYAIYIDTWPSHAYVVWQILFTEMMEPEHVPALQCLRV